MNFFAFTDPDPKSDGILVSKKFWIFVAVAIPLTALTLVYWLYMSHRQDMKRKNRGEVSANILEKGQRFSS